MTSVHEAFPLDVATFSRKNAFLGDAAVLPPFCISLFSPLFSRALNLFLPFFKEYPLPVCHWSRRYKGKTDPDFPKASFSPVRCKVNAPPASLCCSMTRWAIRVRHLHPVEGEWQDLPCRPPGPSPLRLFLFTAISTPTASSPAGEKVLLALPFPRSPYRGRASPLNSSQAADGPPPSSYSSDGVFVPTPPLRLGGLSCPALARLSNNTRGLVFRTPPVRREKNNSIASRLFPGFNSTLPLRRSHSVDQHVSFGYISPHSSVLVRNVYKTFRSSTTHPPLFLPSFPFHHCQLASVTSLPRFT